jgi:tripartite ATP-independent transporter DctP family solute receptor
MRLREKALLGVLLLAIFLALTGCTAKQTATQGGPVVLKLGTETAIDTPETRGSKKLADLVKEKSNGTLVIEVYENARLGTMKERSEGMRMGSVDMGTSSVGFLASYVPLLGIFDLPYVYRDKAHELRVFDSEIGREVDKKLQTQGLRVICYFDAGVRHITNNRKPIRTSDDLKGLRIRVPQTEASIEGFKSLGALPTSLAFGEVYMALKQNVVEGQENPLSLVLHNRFYEVQKYLSLTGHQAFIQVLTISEKRWQQLTPQHQQVLLEAAREAEKYQRQLEAAAEDVVLQELKVRGMQVNHVENVALFAELAAPLRSIYIKKLGEPARELFERIDALRETGEK